jgi:hypothetical protein
VFGPRAGILGAALEDSIGLADKRLRFRRRENPNLLHNRGQIKQIGIAAHQPVGIADQGPGQSTSTFRRPGHDRNAFGRGHPDPTQPIPLPH